MGSGRRIRPSNRKDAADRADFVRTTWARRYVRQRTDGRHLLRAFLWKTGYGGVMTIQETNTSTNRLTPTGKAHCDALMHIGVSNNNGLRR